MKKTFVIILTGILTVSLGACGSSRNTESTEVAIDAEEESAIDTAKEAAIDTEEDVATDAGEDTAEETKVEIPSHTSFRPGQTLTDEDLDILTADKGTALSRTLSQNEFNQIIAKFMDSPYVTDTVYQLAADEFVWNGGSRWDCSSTALYLINYYLLTYDEAYQAAEEADPSADPSSWISTALDSVGAKASAAFPETGNTSPAYTVSQAIFLGNPVYTYQTVNQISEDDPGDLQYGDLLFYGSADESDFRISHVAIYLGQYYLDSGDIGYYQLENDGTEKENTKEGRNDGVKISAFRAGKDLVHVARIF